MQLATMPSEAELGEAYGEAASDAYIEEEGGQRATARATLEAIERFTPCGSLLDLGCWVGFLLAEARGSGLGDAWRRAERVRVALCARAARARSDNRRPIHRRARRAPLRRGLPRRRDRASSAPGRRTRPDCLIAQSRRRRVSRPTGRREPSRSSTRLALVVGPAHSRPVLHTLEHRGPLAPSRVCAAGRRECAEGI